MFCLNLQMNKEFVFQQKIKYTTPALVIHLLRKCVQKPQQQKKNDRGAC